MNSEWNDKPFDNGIEEDERAALLALSTKQKKDAGVFFTPPDLSTLAAEKFSDGLNIGSILDPACGTGNLLYATAKKLQCYPTLEKTLRSWNEKIYGLDINPTFVDLAKRKIIKLAIEKGAVPSPNHSRKYYCDILSNIKVGDFLENYRDYSGVVSAVIMNPPFSHAIAPKSITWTTGRFNVSALFLFYVIEILPENGDFIGILPDVLKSGTRYSEWRSVISRMCNYEVQTFGNFQPGVQVDVFLMKGKKCKRAKILESANSESNLVLSDRFDVSVGPVVPHRDKLIGDEAPFAHAKILPAWETIDTLSERIIHSGRKFKPPFVAVRRTSSPKDKNRAVGCIVNCNEVVAVENHIIVISPKDRSLKSCKVLLEYLRTNFVNEYINSKIRCRHLTVGVIKEIPLERMIYDIKD